MKRKLTQNSYNAAFIVTQPHNNYDIYVVSPGFLSPSDNWTSDPKLPLINYASFTHQSPLTSNISQVKKKASSFSVLKNSDCMSVYAQSFITSRQNVVLVAESHHNKSVTNISYIFGISQYYIADNIGNPFYWICSKPAGRHNPNSNFKNPDCAEDKLPHEYDWTIHLQNQADVENYKKGLYICDPPRDKENEGTQSGSRAESGSCAGWGNGTSIDYCLSERTEDRPCDVLFSPSIMITVVVINALKLYCMTVVGFKMDENPLITVGDAVSSFLRAPDATTKGMCLTESLMIEREWPSKGWPRLYDTPQKYQSPDDAKRWWQGTRGMRWAGVVFV